MERSPYYRLMKATLDMIVKIGTLDEVRSIRRRAKMMSNFAKRVKDEQLERDASHIENDAMWAASHMAGEQARARATGL